MKIRVQGSGFRVQEKKLDEEREGGRSFFVARREGLYVNYLSALAVGVVAS